MNEQEAFCPKCRRETMFIRSTHGSMCQACGFRIESDERYSMDSSGAAAFLKGVRGVLVVVVLIMVALVVVGVAVVFAGCAGLIKGF
jgi:DNA-directed RNA polymerase subunit RPC12/RpoP